MKLLYDRRWIGPKLAVLAGLSALAISVGSASANPPVSELAWGNDEVYVTTFATAFRPTPASPTARHSFYIIAPVDPGHPQEEAGNGSGCSHDHVVPVPAGNHGTFSAVADYDLLVPVLASARVATRHCTFYGSEVDLAWAADLDGNPATDLQPLTSIAKVELAVAEGLVTSVYIDFSATVTVRKAR